MDELIKRLVEAHGPSGFEDNVRNIIRSEVTDYADDVSVDALGNLIVFKAGDGSGLKVMVAAHMDEIGLMVTHITDEGFLRFTNIGGIRPQTLMGSRILFSDGTLGVIHCEKLDSWNTLYGLDKHYIDVGAKDRESCPVQVGWAATFVSPFAAMDGHYVAKSMDDRIGCAIGIEGLRRLKNEPKSPHDLYFVFSVQEEVGTRGAQTSANALQPDVGIALDITLAGDTPEPEPIAVDLGDGPAIKVKDSGMIAHSGLVRHMRSRAKAMEIPYQLEVLEKGSTDARSIQIAGAGAAAGCLSIPCRYAHTQSEVVDAGDVENTVRLLIDILTHPIEL